MGKNISQADQRSRGPLVLYKRNDGPNSDGAIRLNIPN